MTGTKTTPTKLPEDALGAYLELSGRRRFRGTRALVAVGMAAVASLPLAWWAFVLTVDLLCHLCGGGGLEQVLDTSVETCLHGSPLQAFCWHLGIGATAALVLIPSLVGLVQAYLSARALGNLRRTGALEELASTQLTPTRMVDGLAVNAAVRTARAVWIPLLTAAGLLALAGSEGPSPAWAFLALAALPVAFPLLASNELWLRSGDRRGSASWTARLPVLLLLAAPAFALAAVMAGAVLVAGLWAGAAAGILGSLPTAMVYRAAAIQGLEENSVLRRWQARLESTLVGRRTQPHRDDTPNALLFRERAVRSGQGLAGFLRDHAGALAGCAIILALGASEDLWADGIPAVLLVLAVSGLAAFRALLSSSRALFEERQQRTLEVLQQSGVSARDFVKGWSTTVAAGGRADVLLVFGAAVVAALGRGEPLLLAWLLPLGVGALAALESAASWGVAYAGGARQKFDLLPITVTFLSVNSVGLAAAATFLVAPVVVVILVLDPADFSPWAPVLATVVGLAALTGTLAVGALGRYSAVNALIHRPDRPGFTA